ncbi:MAG: hypothetical protein IJU76_10835 [Desulfovibrionaceae bacterium]|nr:hypothetical protein [Desulfovibrionaceae bacterium]
MPFVRKIVPAGPICDIADVGVDNSQLDLAMLTMEIAQFNKANTQQIIAEIESELMKRHDTSDMLKKARDYRQAGLYVSDAGKPSQIDKTFVKFCEDNEITLPQCTKCADSKELDAQWERVIAQIQLKLDAIGDAIQSLIAAMQNIVGQLDSIVQSAQSAIAQAKQVLQSVAK